MRYDAVIVGGGPAGHETALLVSRLGGKAVVVEKGEVGGVCTNRGCIPTKALAASCEAYDILRRAGEFGFETCDVKPDLAAVFKRRTRVALTMRKGVEKLLSDAGVEVVKGEGILKSNTEVGVDGRIIAGDNIVVATGSAPTGLPGIELDGEYVISGDDAAEMNKLPAAIVVVGGGFIGCEYAAIYGRMGCQVTLVEALPRILPAEDEDVSEAVSDILSKYIRVITGVKIESVDKKEKTVRIGGQDVKADMVLMAVGRKPVYPEGLDEVGVAYDNSGIKVDSHMRTSVGNVYAVGDVASELKLAHVAYAGAEVAAGNIMGTGCEVDYATVPWCVFTLPEVGRVGVTEREAGDGVRVGRADYMANGKARCMGERTGFCKVIVDADSDVILGVHILGAHASDLIGEAALAVRNKMTAGQVAETIHPHPTLTEVLRKACVNVRGR